MADIAMCDNQKCPSRHDCYRFMAPISKYRQSYMDWKPKKGEDKCEGFLKFNKKTNNN